VSQQSKQLDVQLLKVLNTLLTEQNITKTSVKLNQSQPAVSAALRRLRELTGDPLLIRAKSKMVPTEHALRLLEPTRNALRLIESITAERGIFDVAESARTFSVACPDSLSFRFLPSLISQFRALAPRARLVVHPLNEGVDFEAALEKGTLDLVVGNWPTPPQWLRKSALFDDDVVCLIGQSHPLAKYEEMTVAQYMRSEHVAPTPYLLDQRSAIDACLERQKLERKVVVNVPYFGLAPYLLMDSDLVFTTSRAFAEHFAAGLPLKIMHSPIDFGDMCYYQLWHERCHLSPEVKWLRDLLSTVARHLAPSRPRTVCSRQPAMEP